MHHLAPFGHYRLGSSFTVHHRSCDFSKFNEKNKRLCNRPVQLGAELFAALPTKLGLKWCGQRRCCHQADPCYTVGAAMLTSRKARSAAARPPQPWSAAAPPPAPCTCGGGPPASRRASRRCHSTWQGRRGEGGMAGTVAELIAAQSAEQHTLGPSCSCSASQRATSPTAGSPDGSAGRAARAALLLARTRTAGGAHVGAAEQGKTRRLSGGRGLHYPALHRRPSSSHAAA